MRFDFSNPQALSADQLEQIQSHVAERIAQDAKVIASTLPLAEARSRGAMMLFGEKYPDPVRMIAMGDFSKELCGGTHLENTLAVDVFEIISEESVSAGTRRIVALTGEKARQHREAANGTLTQIASQLKVELNQVPAAVETLFRYVRDMKKQIERHTMKDTRAQFGKVAHPWNDLCRNFYTRRQTFLNVAVSDVLDRFEGLFAERDVLEEQRREAASTKTVSAETLLEMGEEVAGVNLVVADVAGGNANQLRSLIDQLRRESGSVAALLASRMPEDKVLLVAGISDGLVGGPLDAGRWVGTVAKVVGGGGGGKPGMAQAGGRDAAKIPEALETAREFVRKALQA